MPRSSLAITSRINLALDIFKDTDMTSLSTQNLTNREHHSSGGNQQEFRELYRSDDGIRYFGPDGFEPQSIKRDRPLRVCVITSIRDVGGDDAAGAMVDVRGERVFNKGSLHSLLDACKNELKGIVEVCAILVDDVETYERDQGKLNGKGRSYSVLPDGTGDWIVPLDYRTSDGKGISDLVFAIPSSFRALPKEHPERESRKRDFEESIERMASASGADLILSDHALVQFKDLHKGHFSGRVVNIHPAVTYEGDPHKLRGATPTRDAIARAAAPGGHDMTGASFHFISDEVDGGAVICDIEATRVDPSMTPEELRFDNYRQSKVPLLIRGLAYLAHNFDPLTEAAKLLNRQAERAKKVPDPKSMDSNNLGGLAGE